MMRDTHVFLFLLTYFFVAVIPQTSSADYFASPTTCADVRAGGFTGGQAGFIAGEAPCFYSGGGVEFCAQAQDYTFECAGISISDAEPTLKWPAFDAPEDAQEEDIIAYNTLTTRDATRGRAGHTHALFMDQFGVCRTIDNTAQNAGPVYVPVRTEEEWRAIHGVPAGGDPNGGFTHFANNPNFPATMDVCCRPHAVSICGSTLSSGYLRVGETASLWAGGGFGTVTCTGNNSMSATSVVGICGGGGSSSSGSSSSGGGEGGGGGAAPPSGGSAGGYYNPSNGGAISQNDWNSMSSAAQDIASSQGYGPSEVSSTNSQGAQDSAAAEAQAEEEQATEEATAEAEEAAAEESAQEAQEDAAEQTEAEEAAAAAEQAEQENNNNNDDDD